MDTKTNRTHKKYMSLKNMTDEEKKARKREQKKMAQRRYYAKNKDYYNNYYKTWRKGQTKKYKKLLSDWNDLKKYLEEENYFEILDKMNRMEMQNVRE